MERKREMQETLGDSVRGIKGALNFGLRYLRRAKDQVTCHRCPSFPACCVLSYVWSFPFFLGTIPFHYHITPPCHGQPWHAPAALCLPLPFHARSNHLVPSLNILLFSFLFESAFGIMSSVSVVAFVCVFGVVWAVSWE